MEKFRLANLGYEEMPAYGRSEAYSLAAWLRITSQTPHRNHKPFSTG